MRYRDFGQTGCRVSALGFGGMRLPMKDSQTVERKEAIPLLLRAFELGVNYYDTGKWYCGQDSEKTIGEAIREMGREHVYLSTKLPFEKATGADLEEKFAASLQALGTDYVDFYHFWGISWDRYEKDLAIPNGPLEAALRLRRAGAIRHLSFSFHGPAQDIPRLVDTGHFETMLVQYNLLDRSNEEGIAHAGRRGLGVAIMGPVGGGRLGAPSQVVESILGANKPVSSPEIALRFVLANPNVSLALSGMSNLAQLEQNVAVASRDTYLTDVEQDTIAQAARENKRLMELYCTGCKYCLPCPQDVNIPTIFETMNLYRVWDLKEHAIATYAKIGKVPWMKGKTAEWCEACGACEEKCPQGLKIIDQLRQCHDLLAQKAG